MSRKLLIVVVLAALGYWGYSAWQTSIDRRAQESAAEKHAAQIKASVSALAGKHNAVQDWASNLAQGERTRMSPVLTAELQDLWLASRPILFIGTVSDIERTGKDTVLLSMEYGFLDQGHTFISTTLRLKLQCSINIAQPLFVMAREPSRMALHSDTAVIAAVSSIEATNERDAEGNNTGVLTGIGECLDVVPVQEPVYWWADKRKNQ